MDPLPVHTDLENNQEPNTYIAAVRWVNCTVKTIPDILAAVGYSFDCISKLHSVSGLGSEFFVGLVVRSWRSDLYYWSDK